MPGDSVRAAAAALAFLTRVPVGRLAALGPDDVARSAVLFPVVGAGIGALVGGVAVGLESRLTVLLAAALAVAAEALVTGAIHLDALADTADGLGAPTRERALEVMREPAIGSFGATALGLGAVVTVAATTAAADITGLVLASVVAAVGFFILPAKRRKAKEEMRAKIADVRRRLSEALRRQFTTEIQRSGNRIRESIAPYSRFIRAEGDKLRTAEAELREIGSAIASLRARIDHPAA